MLIVRPRRTLVGSLILIELDHPAGDFTLTPYALCSLHGINKGASVEVKASQRPKLEL